MLTLPPLSLFNKDIRGNKGKQLQFNRLKCQFERATHNHRHKSHRGRPSTEHHAPPPTNSFFIPTNHHNLSDDQRFYRSMHIVQATTVLFLRARSLQILNSAKLSTLAATDFKNDELYSSTSVVRSKFRLKFIDEIYNRKSTLKFSSNENEFYDKHLQYFASISKYTITYFNDCTLENQIWQAVDQPLSRDYYTFLSIESQENAFQENVKLLGTCFPVDGEIENLPSWTNSRSSSSGQMYDKMYRQTEDDAHSDVAYYQLHALKSYLQTCVACGMVGRAYQTLIRYVYPKTQKESIG
ncbi:hypothetical protein Tsp_13007 [Trichinella spiralis]|uniref:hypothetical protein n=1 Tax=Trichinella spiralis TaxID=6334 RepID=UPI0001EFDA59|nr:hypothetical protein Tsp_13007 [Trichinella spiralis]